MHLRAHLRFHLREQLKMRKNVKKKIHFTHQLMMIHLTVQSRGALEGKSDGALKDATRNPHKDAQKGACEVAL